jgi:catechol 2,3-dioxygenase-like lactoylglutathione lyase family enzyme
MKAIEIISIPVSDQLRAKTFYQQLGFNVLVEAPFEGDKKWIQMGLPGDGPSITLVTWFGDMPAGCVQGFVIKTDDVEKDKQEFTEKGIETGKIDQTPWGKFLSVKDPDGNSLSFHQN